MSNNKRSVGWHALDRRYTLPYGLNKIASLTLGEMGNAGGAPMENT